MSKDIRIKRGYTLRLKGEAEKTLVDAPRSRTYAIKPPDFHAVIPKMVLKEGARVDAGRGRNWQKACYKARRIPHLQKRMPPHLPFWSYERILQYDQFHFYP